MSNLPKKFRISNDHLPRAWSQGAYNCCVMASFIKVLEMAYYKKTGKKLKLSIPYAYGRHSNPNFKSFSNGGGGDYDYTMTSLLNRGSVPEEMYPHMNEIPNIIFDVENAPNLAELDKEAEKTKAESVIKIPGDGYFKQNVKKYLYENNLPLVGNMTGRHHCTVIVGWDEDGFEFCDHDGRVDSKTGKAWVYGGGRFNSAYTIDCGTSEDNEVDNMNDNKKLPFTDVNETDWFYDALKEAYEDGVINGISETEFAPNKPLTRAEFAMIYSRLKNMEG